MDRLLELQTFARVVELGGFTKAGDSLQLSKTTVSDLVQSLEARLGVRLFQRTTRRVMVTPEGAAFYERCASILADLEEAEASVMQARVALQGTARVDLPARSGGCSSFQPFRNFSPATRTCAWSSGRAFVRCICWRRVSIASCAWASSRTQAWSRGESARCASSVVRAPSICGTTARRAGRKTCRHTAVSTSCRIARDESSIGNSFEMGRRVQPTLDGVLAVNDHEAITAAGVTSIGIVRLLEYVAVPYLESGQLTQVLTDWTADQEPIAVMYPQSRHLSGEGAHLRRVGQPAGSEKSASLAVAYCSQEREHAVLWREAGRCAAPRHIPTPGRHRPISRTAAQTKSSPSP